MDLKANSDTFRELKDRLSLSGMGKPALAGILVVILVVGAFAITKLAGAATTTGFEVSRAAAEGQEVASSSSTGSSTLFVHVSGAVVNPGLYEVENGARVADAVNAAGGFAEDAATDSVNLARMLIDGEQVVVASTAETVGAGGGAQAAPAAGGTPAASSNMVNINSASAVELTELPGVGEATAAKIVSDRQANGPFKTIDDLKRVSGIGDKRFEALRDLICV